MAGMQVFGDNNNPLQGTSDAKTGNPQGDIGIAGPLAFWIIMLLIGLAFLILFPAGLTNAPGSISFILYKVGSYIIYMPGAIIFPLVVALWIGMRTGANTQNIKKAIDVGVINAIYTGVIYTISIFIIYLIAIYSSVELLKALPTNTFVVYLVIIPVATLLILTPLIGLLRRARSQA
ncbi:MAG: hypothetical protein M1128_01040 [Candidatus Marsarchaeota archaeon]|nr:hypothetical protein [Candidatus Marsarchaeota archaeon]